MANIGAMPGKSGTKELRYPSNGKTIYHRPLARGRTSELSQASFAYLFSEMVSYAQKRVTGISDLEKRFASPFSPPPHLTTPTDLAAWCYRLNIQGHPIGVKLLDLLLIREPPRSQARPLTIVALLHFIKGAVFQHLFGRAADGLERSSDATTPDEYLIIDNEPLVNAYVSVPREMDKLSCAAFVAGIVEGVCDGAAFPARVTAHSVGGKGEGEMWPGKTVFLVKFQGEVLEREALLGVGKG